MSAKRDTAPRAGEISLKQWLNVEAKNLNIKPNTLRMQLDRGTYYWPRMRTINKRLIWVLP